MRKGSDSTKQIILFVSIITICTGLSAFQNNSKEKTQIIEDVNGMGHYKLEEDIKVYRDNKSKCLLFTRITLGVAFIILFLMGKKPFEIMLIDAISYFIENILNTYLNRCQTMIIATILM